jgi:hypothetical protein
MPEPTDTITEASEWRWHDFWKAAALIAAVLGAYGLVVAGVDAGTRLTLAETGQFGDAFGLVNALFSGLAFAGVLFSLEMQRRELGLQREELAATREVLQEERDALTAQHAVMLQQLTATREYSKQPILQARVWSFEQDTVSGVVKLACHVENLSEDIALNVVVHCYLLLREGVPDSAACSEPAYIGVSQLHVPVSEYSDPIGGDQREVVVHGFREPFVHDGRRPEIVVRCLFRNVTGGTFATWASIAPDPARSSGLAHIERRYLQVVEPDEEVWRREAATPSLDAVSDYLRRRTP